jgi:acetylglutamate kinase
LQNVMVVKIGGSTFDKRDTTIEDIVSLQKQGKPLVVVHGGANVVTGWLTKQGINTRFVHGERVTDLPTLEVVIAVLAGLVNKEIVAAINNLGGQAVGISGVDGALIQGKMKDEEKGYMGTVVQVNPALLEALLGAGLVPVVSPLSMHTFDRPPEAPLIVNINGDPVAGEIAAALSAERLIFLTDVAGIRDQSGSIISKLSDGEAAALMASGVASGGMIPKINACLRALSCAVGTTRIIDGRQPHALLEETEGRGSGTTIYKE